MEPQPFLPQLLNEAFSQIMDGLHDHLMRTGHGLLRPTHFMNVFRFMDCDGTRPADLARRAGMTPQAMGELISFLEEHQYVQWAPDPADGRSRVVVWADQGLAAAQVAADYFAKLELEWAEKLGERQLQALKKSLLVATGGVVAKADPSSRTPREAGSPVGKERPRRSKQQNGVGT